MKDTMIPLGDRVIIKAPADGDTKSKKGKIILTESSTRGESTWGEVLLVGKGIYTQNGILIPMTVKKGDMVMYKKDMVGDTITIEGDDYIMFREHDLIMADCIAPNSMEYDTKSLLCDSMCARNTDTESI